MKKLLFGLVVMLMVSTTSFAQSFSKTTQKEIVDFEKIFGPLVNHDFSGITNKEVTTFEYVMPIYTLNGSGLVLVVVNQYGVKGVLASKNIKMPEEAKTKIKDVITNFSVPLNSPDSRFLCWKCLLSGIQHLIEAIDEIIDAFNQP